MRIIFMGTPEFAIPSLEILIQNGFEMAAVITAPDKPAGRGRALQESAVKKAAQKHGIKILQPTNLKSESFLADLKSLQADLQVVVAFRMLPEVVWNMPPKGTLNLHGSLLPDYRGAAPINWAIINGEKETGVTTFFIDKKIDTGHIIFQKKMEIGEPETAGELHDRMMIVGADLILKTVKAIEIDVMKPQPQQFTTEHKRAPKIFKEDCKIDWNQSANTVFNFIRGLSPYPASWTIIDNKMLKIYNAEKELTSVEQTVGSVIIDNGKMKIAAKDGYLIPTRVQLQGKRKMSTIEFLRGFKTGNGS